MRRLTSIALLMALLGALLLAPMGALAATRDGKFLKNMPVTGTLSDGGTFKGKVTITEFGYTQVGDRVALTVSGVLKGTAITNDGVVEDISQPFTSVRASLAQSAGSAGAGFQLQATCDILDLDIGPIHLDLLGLVVDLSAIHLDITAVSGPGNLLGNLLCALAGLLDPGGFLIGLLDALTALLEQINQLIG